MPDRVGAPTRQLSLYTAILQLLLVNRQEKRFFFVNVSSIYSGFSLKADYLKEFPSCL